MELLDIIKKPIHVIFIDLTTDKYVDAKRQSNTNI